MKTKSKNAKKRAYTILTLLPAILVGAFSGIVMMHLSEQYAEKNGGGSFPYLMMLLLFLVASAYIQLILHELGHLIFGLLSGYRFSSFRIGSLMLLYSGKKFRFARLSIAGTAGQCLMSPPEPDAEGRIPVKLFNLGGALSNLFFSALFLVIYLLTRLSPLSAFFLLCAAVGLSIALTNGIPMRNGMVDNDGYNAFSLGKNPLAIRAFYVQLKVNEQITEGVRLSDMPEEWFSLPAEANRKNPIIATIDVFACNRAMDAGEFPKAEAAIRALLAEENGMIGLHKNLLICDLITLLIGSGRGAEIDAYLTKEQKKFMQMMRTFPSVIRTEYLIAKYVYGDTRLTEIHKKHFDRMARRYPYPADLISERMLMALPETPFSESTVTE